jgi:hypothetical protein
MAGLLVGIQIGFIGEPKTILEKKPWDISLDLKQWLIGWLSSEDGFCIYLGPFRITRWRSNESGL